MSVVSRKTYCMCLFKYPFIKNKKMQKSQELVSPHEMIRYIY